jgi:UDP-glucuronate 4-epimerase
VRYLVTGGAGFIGSHLVDRLLAEGAHVSVVDNFDPFYPRRLKVANLALAARHPHFRLIEADVCDESELRVASGSYDCIIHLAGRGGVRPSILDPARYQQINVLGTQNVLEFARRHNVPQFVFASSSSVYGTNPSLPWREDECVLQPISPYAATKVSGEMLGHIYAHLYGMRFVALRFFTVYGPRQRPDLAIRKFAEMILADKAIPVFGAGGSCRDYTFVGDIIAGIKAAIDYRASSYEVINLGNNQPVPLMEMIRALEDALGRKAILQCLPEQPGDLPSTWGCGKKANRLLGYAPQTEFARGIEQFVDWLTTEFQGTRSDQHEVTYQ